jgi:hypothetical protein
MSEYTYSDELMSDLHKDAYGSRPGSSYREWWQTLSADAKQAEWDLMCAEMRLAEERQAQMQAEAVESFEAGIKTAMVAAGCDRATAIRYQIEAMEMEFEWDPGYICYCLGLPYHKGYEEEFLPFIRNEREAA